MPTYVEYPSSGALLKRCRALQEAVGPRSVLLARCREDWRLTIAEDHYEMMLRGVDRYGRPRAQLADSTTKGGRSGPGPSLIPRYYLSRFIANLEVLWVRGDDRVHILVKRFRDILSKPTKNHPARPFAQYHLTGASRRTSLGNLWVLPRRDVGGVTPAGFRRLQERWALFVQELARYQR
jgi:hypothetical protein